MLYFEKIIIRLRDLVKIIFVFNFVFLLFMEYIIDIIKIL